MNSESLQHVPHRRWNLLLREWVLVSPQRLERPWQGHVGNSEPPRLQYDPHCYLCPGNRRFGGQINPQYSGTFAFDNDFPALLPEVPEERVEENGLLVAETERGICRVLCFSPRHDLTVPLMSVQNIEIVVEAWARESAELSALPWVRHVEVFENRGALMGTSNPHPHCQIWANRTLPNVPAREQAALDEYVRTHRECLLCAYLGVELKRGERLVCQNAEFVALVPYWAVWPFEVLVLSRRHLANFCDLRPAQQKDLADLIQRVTVRFDNLFETEFPYSMGFHQSPANDGEHREWHFHAHYYPPLLRSATVQKFMVGYELLASPQRDVTAEIAAQRLRDAPETHYSVRHGSELSG